MAKYDINKYPGQNGYYGQYGGSFMPPHIEEEFAKISIRNLAEIIPEHQLRD